MSAIAGAQPFGSARQKGNLREGRPRAVHDPRKPSCRMDVDYSRPKDDSEF